MNGCFIDMVEHILLTGGTGIIGNALIQRWTEQGHRIRILSRSAPKPPTSQIEWSQWDPASRMLDPKALDNITTVVHLAGAPVAQRWTVSHRQEILSSRLEGANVILDAVAQRPSSERPGTFISASAIGLYPSAESAQSESGLANDSFIGSVVEQWEAAADQYKSLEMRVVKIRIGLVLSKQGGFVARMRPVFKFGLGSALGSGKQWQSWIHVDDLARIFDMALTSKALSGPINAVTPHPVRNDELGRTLARALIRPYWAPRVPAWILRIVFGEMSTIMLQSHRIEPSVLVQNNFEFQYSKIEDAWSELFS